MKKLIVLLFVFCSSSLFSASIEWNKAYKAYQSENWEEAIELFEKVGSDDGQEYAKAQRYIGYNIYGRELGKWKKAIEHCINAYEADPDNEKVLEDLGRACLKRQKQLLNPPE